MFVIVLDQNLAHLGKKSGKNVSPQRRGRYKIPNMKKIDKKWRPVASEGSINATQKTFFWL